MNRRRSWAVALLAGLGTERGIGVLFLVIGAGALAVSRRRRG